MTIFCIKHSHNAQGFFKSDYRFLIEALISRKPHGFHENFALFGNASRMAQKALEDCHGVEEPRLDPQTYCSIFRGFAQIIDA
jgi:hypothetical protein|tara:strand:- start:164 stop:412 length:249 start_codon:yes stop_codon:yes gene_type:complete